MESCLYTAIWAVLFLLTNATQFYSSGVPSRISEFKQKPAKQFRTLLLDPSEEYVYVGAQNSIYKLRLTGSSLSEDGRHEVPSIKDVKPNFKDR